MIGKFYCRVFCHINSLGDKISNTGATKQPNLFGFGKNYHQHIMVSRVLLSIDGDYVPDYPTLQEEEEEELQT